MKPDVVIMAELDWGGLYSQSHVLAKGFADIGHRVFYMNRTLQRWPRLRHLITRLRPTPGLGVTSRAEVPPGITVINLWVGPPVRLIRMLNKFLIKRTMRNYSISEPVFITYVPTFNSIDLAEVLNARITSYICYHNFDADIVVPDLLISERQITLSADLLFADSHFLMNRIRKLSGGRKVYPSPPGVHFENFRKAFRGNEVDAIKKICFYGGAGHHLDLDVYNRFCDFYSVIFIAVINPEIRNLLDPRITIIDPVPNHLLPELLREMDVLTILYKRSDYIDGVIPAKFFECIATGKPVLVSGLLEAGFYGDYVYETGNSADTALEIIKRLPVVHNSERTDTQFKLGKSADFKLRFEFVYDKIMDEFKLKYGN